MPYRTIVHLLAALLALSLCRIGAAQEKKEATIPDPTVTPTTPPASPANPTHTEPQITPAVTETWIIRIDPNIWWVSPSGKLQLPSSAATAGDKVRVENLNLDSPALSPAGSFTINAGEWRFGFSGAAYSRDTNSTADTTFRIGDVSLAPGDPFHASFDFGIFELDAGYRVYARDFRMCSENQDVCVDVGIDLYAIGGTRMYDMSMSVTPPAGAGSASDQFFIEAIAGIRAEASFMHKFMIAVQLTGGGMADSDRTSYSWDITVIGEWRPWTNVGFELGWRQSAYSFEDGDGPGKFSYDGAMAGVFAGLVIRF